MPVDLPPEVLQGMPWNVPPPIDSSLAGAPMPDALPQVDSSLLGLQPPEQSVPVPPPAPADGPPQAIPQRGEFVVPASIVGHPGALGQGGFHSPVPPPAPVPHPGAPPHPMGADQLLGRAQTQESKGETIKAQGIADETDAQRAQAADEMAAYKQYDAQSAELKKQQAALAADTQKIHLQKQAFVDATMRDVDSYKIDQSKYVKEMGLGTMAGWGIAMILSGIGDALQGKTGPNAVTQMLQDKIHTSVQLQLDARDQLEKKGQRAQHDLDKYDAFSKDRMATMNLMEAQYEKRLAMMIQEAAVKSKDPMARARGEKEAGDLLISSADKAQKAGEAAATNEVAKKQLGVAQGHLALAGQQFGLEKQKFGWQKEKDTVEIGLKATKEKADASSKEKQLAVAAPTVDGKVGPLTNKDGSVAQFRSAEIAQKTSDMVAGATAYNRLVGKMAAALKDHGGSSTWVKGEDWQRMMSDLQSATAELHDAYGITAFREPTVQFFEKMATAGVDPTSFVRDATAALKESNVNLQAKVNEKARAGGYDGPDIAFASTDAPASAPTPAQQLSTLLKAKPDENRERAWQSTYAQNLKASNGDVKAATVAANNAMAEAGAVSPAQRQGIQTLTQQAVAGDKDAAAVLADVAKTAKSTTVRSLAEQALSEIRTTVSAPGPEPITSAGPTFDPNGYDPQSLVDRFHRKPEPTLASGQRSP